MDKEPIDDQFKKYFEGRHLNPEDKSWDRLDAMLTVSEKTQKPLLITWHHFAAAIAIFICVGIWWSSFKENAVQKNGSSFVQESDINDGKENIVHLGNHKEMEESGQEIPVQQKRKSNVKPSVEEIKKEEIFADADSAMVYEAKIDIPEPSSDVITLPEPKLLNVSGEHFAINPDKLLKDVEERILFNKQISKNSRIDPKALLAEAELNADRSFLKKVYKNIQEGAETVIAVVSNRNYAK